MKYRWIWYEAAASSRKGNRAHAFAEGAQESVCTYVTRARANEAIDLGLLLHPRFCQHCDTWLKRHGLTAEVVTELGPD